MTGPGHETLGDEDERDLAAAREWVKGHFSEPSDLSYMPVLGKLRLLKAILANEWVERSETWKLQALGICFGDALAQELTMNWVIVNDEYGRSPALNWPGTTIYIFPQTMISKRVERGETVEIQHLFENVAEMVRKKNSSGEWV